MVISGSPPPGYDPNIYFEMIEEAHKKNCRVILDAQKSPLKNALAARPWMIKINRAELETTLEQTIDSEERLQTVAGEIIGQGVEQVIITEGAKTVRHFSKKQSTSFQPPTIKAINAIGSGDAMAAGMACASLENQPLDFVIKMGIACGAANALSPITGNINGKLIPELMKKLKNAEL